MKGIKYVRFCWKLIIQFDFFVWFCFFRWERVHRLVHVSPMWKWRRMLLQSRAAKLLLQLHNRIWWEKLRKQYVTLLSLDTWIDWYPYPKYWQMYWLYKNESINHCVNLEIWQIQISTSYLTIFGNLQITFSIHILYHIIASWMVNISIILLRSHQPSIKIFKLSLIH